MKGDEVEGLRGGRWKGRHTLEVARRRKGKGAGAVNRRGGRDSLSARLQELHFPSHYAPYHCDRPWKPPLPLKLIYIEILNDTHRPEQ